MFEQHPTQSAWFRNALIGAVLLLLTPSLILCQGLTGTLLGTVRDASGAVVPGAGVTVTNQNTGFTFQLLTDRQGSYMIPYLGPGAYKIIVENSGFRTVVSLDNTVHVNETTRVDFRLSIGGTTQSVEVRSEALRPQMETPGIQHAVTQTLIDALPNINHNAFYYASLQPGVTPRAAFNDTQNVYSFGIGIDGRRYYSALSVGGGQAFTNDFLLDGLSIQGSAWNEAAVLPNPEGLQETRTIINGFPAEYGRAQGVIALTTRTGANRYELSVFDRFRNEVLNANRFGNNARGISRPAFKVNSYGATLGGPIRRNRAFFFISYAGLRHSEQVDYLRTVPTERERSGDFSETYINVAGVPRKIKLFDPFRVKTVSGEANLFQRAEIPNSIISNPDPFALRLMSFYPAPNRDPADIYNGNNYFNRVTRTFLRNSINSRVDFRQGRHSIYGTTGITQGRIRTPRSWGDDNPFDSPNGTVGAVVSDMNPYTSIGDTITLSSRMLLDIRYGISRINTANEASTIDGFDYGQLGIPKALQASNAVPGAPPELRLNGLSPLNRTNSVHKRERQTNQVLTASTTMAAGRWILKFGAEYRVYLSNYTDPEESFQIRTQENLTRQYVDAVGNPIGSATADLAGWAPASLLLGAGAIYVAPSRGAKPALAQKYLALYAQNDWKVSRRLTLNLGLRWDLQPGPTERFDRISSFDFTKKNPYGTPGSIAYSGSQGYSRNYWDTRYRDFGPRIGAAYEISEKSVIRGGYGITYLPTNTGYFGTAGMYGMEAFAPYVSSDLYGPRPAGVLVGRYYEVSHVVQPPGPDVSWPGQYGADAPGRWRSDRHEYRNGRVQQWNLFLERRLGSSWFLSAGYLGSKGSNLPFARVPLNSLQFIDPALLASWRQDYIARNGNGHAGLDQVPNPFQPDPTRLIPFNGNLGKATISRFENLLPYPHFGQMQLQRSIGNSDYNALQLELERLLARGFLLDAHYTWSKSLDFNQTEAQTNGFADTGGYELGIDQLNLKNNRKLSFTDLPHRLVLSFIYELPFGPGKTLLVKNSLLRSILGGWRIAGVGSWQSGFPVEITGASDNALNGRPDRDWSAPVEVSQSLRRWYDGKTTIALPGGRLYTPCAGSASAPCFLKYNPDGFRGRVIRAPNGAYLADIFWYGNAAYTFSDIRAPGQNNWNLNIERTFRPSEGFSLELSAQFTNLFNSTQLRPGVQGGLGSVSTLAPDDSLNVSRLRPGQGTASTFGTFGTDTFDPRQVELQIKLRF